MNPTAQAKDIIENFSIDTLHDKIKEKAKFSRDKLHANHPHVKNFLLETGLELDKMRSHSAKLLAAGSLGTSLLLSPVGTHAATSASEFPIKPVVHLDPSEDVLHSPPQDWMISQLGKVLRPIHDPWAMPFLTYSEEKVIGKIIERATGVPAVANLEGEHLNTIYGNIGAEQHLRRWPGDDISNHGEFAHVEGMAPGNGGFGYFAKGLNDKEGIEREKYYVAVQTLYLPDWEKRLRYLVNWYKWRKVIVVNPDNGQAVVAVVGDAGPAAWTGKHFGGSPEVMHHLGGKRYKKGRVLLLFVDDPENKVPLGPVNYDYTKIKGIGITDLETLLEKGKTE